MTPCNSLMARTTGLRLAFLFRTPRVGTSLPENDDKDRGRSLVLGLGSCISQISPSFIRLFANLGVIGHIYTFERHVLDTGVLSISSTCQVGVHRLFQ